MEIISEVPFLTSVRMERVRICLTELKNIPRDARGNM